MPQYFDLINHDIRHSIFQYSSSASAVLMTKEETENGGFAHIPPKGRQISCATTTISHPPFPNLQYHASSIVVVVSQHLLDGP